MYARTPYLNEHLQKIGIAYHLEINEVTTGASLSTGTSRTMNEKKLLNHEIIKIIRSHQESNLKPVGWQKCVILNQLLGVILGYTSNGYY